MSQKRRDLHLLTAEWAKRLKESGFEDIEDKKGRLKSYDRRTINFDNRDMIRDFYLALDAFLAIAQELSPKHRRILELYSCGIHSKVIAEKVDLGRTQVWAILKKYKKQILGNENL